MTQDAIVFFGIVHDDFYHLCVVMGKEGADLSKPKNPDFVIKHAMDLRDDLGQGRISQEFSSAATTALQRADEVSGMILRKELDLFVIPSRRDLPRVYFQPSWAQNL